MSFSDSFLTGLQSTLEDQVSSSFSDITGAAGDLVQSATGQDAPPPAVGSRGPAMAPAQKAAFPLPVSAALSAKNIMIFLGVGLGALLLFSGKKR